jgi:hypothetical protein
MKKQKEFYNKLARVYYTNGFNIKQAYLSLRPKVKSNTAEVEGSKALRNPLFLDSLNELSSEAKDRYNINMFELVKDLQDIKNKGLKSDLKSSLKAIDLLIKIAGEYAPTKTENKNKDIINWTEEIDGLDINIE